MVPKQLDPLPTHNAPNVIRVTYNIASYTSIALDYRFF
jgi:hypothetical protein